jgi:hypothetical protein
MSHPYMRALVLLAMVVVVVIAAVLRFQDPLPTETPVQDPAATAEARFLSRPPAATVAAAPATQDVASAELEVASAVAHGVAGDLERVLTRRTDYPAGRGRLARAFALALGGGDQGGAAILEAMQDGSIEAADKALLRAAVGGEVAGVRPGEAGAKSAPLTLAMEIALTEHAARAALAAGKYAEAARGYSDVLLAEIGAPWEPSLESLARWTRSLEEAQARHRWNPRGDWPAEEIVVESGDSAISIRKRYLAKHPERIMCAGLILRANSVEGYLQPGQKLRVPTESVRMLVDLSSRWALYLIGDEVAGSWPVGIGRPGQETPPGSYVAREKTENPPWLKVGQEPIPFGDPRNPLGTRWIGWFRDGVKTSYGFHGTKEPESVGTACSDGCVRFRNDDVEVLFEILPEGAPILVQP